MEASQVNQYSLFEELDATNICSDNNAGHISALVAQTHSSLDLSLDLSRGGERECVERIPLICTFHSSSLMLKRLIEITWLSEMMMTLFSMLIWYM